MKACPICGRTYKDDATRCERCESELVEASAATDDTMSESELRKRRKRDWLIILVGVPCFILLIYLIYQLVFAA